VSLRDFVLASIGAAALVGCASVERLTADGEYSAAIERALSRRRPPRGKQARAWALALVRTDRVDEARGVLLGDFQRGGGLASLTMLADLELAHGLEGTAAVHYARIVDRDVTALAGRDDVCELLRRRADGFARAGAGAAAGRDLDRATTLCGEPTDARSQRRLAQSKARATAAQQAEVDARVALSVLPAETMPELPDPARALADAASAGPVAIRSVASRYALTLSPEQVVTLLVADLSGSLSTAVIEDDEVRRWVGDSQWSDFAPRVMSLPQGSAAYLRLRLGAVLDDMPVGPNQRLGPGERAVWVARATDSAGPAAWRVFAWLGDLGATELALGTAWRPRPTPPAPAAGAAGGPEQPDATPESPRPPQQEPAAEDTGRDTSDAGASGSTAAAPDPVERQVAPDKPSHWTSRLPPTEQALHATLMLARLRHGRGRPDLALEMARYAIARAEAERIPNAGAIAAQFAGWHLAGGRFAQALATADAAPSLLAPMGSAAATGLLLARDFCGGPCKDDEDQQLVARVMGDAWFEDAAARLAAQATSGRAPLPAAGSCPTVGERFAADGPLADVLDADGVSKGPSPTQVDALAHVVQADITLGCAARDATTLWVPMSPSPTAQFTSDLLAHEPGVATPTTLSTMARLAMLGGRPFEAETLAVAAAASARDPRAQWLDTARFAEATGNRSLVRLALRQTLLHTPGLRAPAVREALLFAGLSDSARSWGGGQTEVGRETLGRHIQAHLDAVAPAQRWAMREALLWRVGEGALGPASADDVSPQWRSLVIEQLLGPAATERHAFALARAGSGAAPPPASAFDVAGLTLAALGGSMGALPPAAASLGHAVRLAPVRLALAQHATDWQTRWRTAIGLAVYGSPRMRAEGMKVLLAMASPSQRAAVVRLMLVQPAAVEPPDDPAIGFPVPESGHGVRAVPLIADEDVLLRLAAGLELASAWLAR